MTAHSFPSGTALETIWPSLVSILYYACDIIFVCADEIDAIMTYWGMTARGFSAYRAGTCLPRIVTTYGPIWLTTVLNGMMLNPAILMLKAMPEFKKALVCIQQLLHLVREDEKPIQEQLDDLSKVEQYIASTILANITISSSFGLFTPLLMVFSSLQPLLYQLAYGICDIMQQQTKQVTGEPSLFLQHLVVRIKTPVPTKLFGRLVSSTFWCMLLLVLFDFGFSPGSWVLFLCYTAGYAVSCVWYHLFTRVDAQNYEPFNVCFQPEQVTIVEFMTRPLAMSQPDVQDAQQGIEEVSFPPNKIA